MGNRTSGYGASANPDYSAQLSWHIQQERPDGSLWSVTFFLEAVEQTASRRIFATRLECENYAASVA